jgi:hypothetical protein
VYCEVTVSYVYATPHTWEQYTEACEELGWNRKSLLTQILHSYGGANLDYYREAAEMDAIARGFEGHKGEHYRLLRNWGELPRYVGTQPAFERSPLADIPEVSTQAGDRRSFVSIRCSGRNSAILHLATVIERSNVPQTLSRIMLWHFGRYWGKGYALQLESDQQETLSPEI